MTTFVKLLDAARWLRRESRRLDPGGKVTHVYHPLSYAWRPHKAYVERYGAAPKKAVLVGMNPGPWGMGQTGVPFGDVEIVGQWLGLGGIKVDQPDALHEKRPVMGWSCHRSEGSGRRLWGYLQERFATAERALRDLFIVNHCPLLMYTKEGTNVTPDKLPKASREEVFAVCDEGLLRAVRALEVEALIGVGRYAEERCQVVKEAAGLDVEVLRILHPSPASPLANKDGGGHWRREVDKVFKQVGLL
jgi:single-strand selective monofunctional uracil DNA glycosylase